MSFLDRYLGFVVGLVATMIMARLLTPADLGTYSVVMALVAFVAVFRDFGASQYLIRHPAATASVMRRTFTVQLGLGVLLGALMAMAGGPLGRFYDEPRMQAVCWVLGANFLITPFMAYPVAWFTRQMRFGALAWCRVSGALAGAMVSIGLVIAGRGPVALAWGNFATTAAGIAVILLFMRPALPWRPLWTGLLEVVRFGGILSVAVLLQTLRTGLPELISGRVMGLAQASYLSRGQGLCSLFDTLVMGAVGPVTLPYLSNARREGQPLGPILARALALLCGLGWPFFAVLAVLSEPLMALLFGPQWLEAAGPARWLALAAAAGLPLSLLWPALVAGGNVKSLVAMNLISTLAVGAGFVMGTSHSLEAAAFGMGLAAATSLPVILWAFRGVLGVQMVDFTRPLAQALLLAAAAAVPASVLASLETPDSIAWLVMKCGASAALALAGMALAARLLRHPLWIEFSRRERWLG